MLTILVDAESIPSVNLLQGGLLNDEGYLREFFLFIKRLLKCATTDPGFINAKEVCVIYIVILGCVMSYEWIVTLIVCWF